MNDNKCKDRQEEGPVYTGSRNMTLSATMEISKDIPQETKNRTTI